MPGEYLARFVKYRPSECPECGLMWGEFHGHTYGQGYQRLAAYVWECMRCRAIVEPQNPSHRRVAKR